MSVILRDCLDLPLLKQSKVLAGEAGLNKIVDNVSVLEFVYGDSAFQTTNELILTALHFAKDNLNAQCEALESLAESGGVGVVLFYSDIILGGIDKKLIEIADRLNLPLMVLPGKDMMITYSSVISEISELLISDKRKNEFLVNEIIERVSQMPEEYQTIDNVLQIISDRIKASIFISDDKDIPIASARYPHGLKLEFNDVTNESIVGYTYLKECLSIKNCANLKLMIVDSSDRITKELLMQSAKAIELFVVLWNYNLNSSAKESIISAILSKNFTLADYIAKKCNISQSDFDSMMLIKLTKGANTTDNKTAIVNNLKNLFTANNMFSIIDHYGNTVIALFHGEGSLAKSAIIKTDCEDCLESHCAGCNYCTFNKVEEYEELYSSYMLFQDSIESAKIIYPLKKEFTVEELRFANSCYKKLNSSYGIGDKLIDLIQPLYDELEEPLSETLTVYLLDANSEAKKTSELLFVHRNTVQYRLNKIREILGYDITKFPASIDIYMAVALARLKFN